MTTATKVARASSWNVPRWLAGFALGLLGDQVFYLALSWSAVQITTPAAAGMIVGIGALPRVVLLLVGGTITDRVGARRVALLSDSARLLIMLCFALILVSASAAVPVLLTLALLFGAVDAFFLPSVGALPARIVEQSGLPRTQATRSAIQRLASVAGPPLGGLVLSSHGLGAALGLNALLFAMS